MNPKNSRVIRERHDLVVVGGRELEGMCELVGFIAAQNLLQALFVTEILEVLVILRHPARIEELDHARIRQRIEIAAQNQLDTARILDVYAFRRLQRLHRLLQNALQLVTEHHRLDQFHIAEFRIPMNMGRTHQNRLLHERGV